MQRPVFGGAFAAALLVGTMTGAAAETARPGPVAITAPGAPEALQYLGQVQSGVFRAFGCGGAVWPLALTSIQRQEARSVDSGRLDLGVHEGDVLVVEGIPNGGWIYQARVVEIASPVIAALAQGLSQDCAQKKLR